MFVSVCVFLCHSSFYGVFLLCVSTNGVINNNNNHNKSIEIMTSLSFHTYSTVKLAASPDAALKQALGIPL